MYGKKAVITLAFALHLIKLGDRVRPRDNCFRISLGSDAQAILGCRAPDDPAGEVDP
jgi:hypothetical protein